MNFILCKLFLLLFGMCIYITYQIKKCVYNLKKKNVCICVCGVVLINILKIYFSPKQKFLTLSLVVLNPKHVIFNRKSNQWSRTQRKEK